MGERHAFHTSGHACKRPDIATMDHVSGDGRAPLRPVVNRYCLTCGTHWYGDAHAAVFEIPGKVWDLWMNQKDAA